MKTLKYLIDNLGWNNLSNESQEIFKRLLVSIDENTASIEEIQNQEPAPAEDSRPYKVYTALISQSSTSAPVATVLENTLDATITWSYVGTGQYFATASSAVFTVNKTVGILSNSTSTGTNAFVNISTTVFNTVTSVSGVATNNQLFKNMVEIRVYN